MIRTTVYPALLLLHALASAATMQYYLNLLYAANWNAHQYYTILIRENFRWLPLIFGLVPAAAFVMDYGLAAAGIAALYLAVVTVVFWPWPQHPVTKWPARVRRGLFLWAALWLVTAIVLMTFFDSGSVWRPVLMCVILIIQPLLPPLLCVADRPLARLVGRHFIRGSEGILSVRRELKIIAVTGSSDDGPLREAMQEILSARYRCELASQTVTSQMDAAQIIRDIDDLYLEYLICRIDAGSAEEMKAIIDALQPEIAVQASSDYYALIEDIRPSKERGIRFINGDDLVLRQYIGTDEVLTYGLWEGNDCRGRLDRVDASGSSFTVMQSKDRMLSCKTTLLGDDNLNALVGAISVAYVLGIPEEEIQQAILRLKPQTSRMELSVQDGMILIDDSANEEELDGETALDTLQKFDGVKILISCGFLRQGAIQDEANRRFGAHAAGVCDRIVLIGSEVPHGLRIGILEAGFMPENLSEKDTREEALLDAAAMDTDGQQKVVLLECPGANQSRSYNVRQ